MGQKGGVVGSFVASYCDLAPGHPLHGPYHDTEYGFPARAERVLFERLALEIMQAGLSWEIVLKKRKALNAAFDRFHPAKVALYTEKDVARLLADAGIIRNRLKVKAIVENARIVLELRKSHGSFAKWLDAHHPQPKDEWVRLMRRTFRFMGGEIVGEFLMSLGYLPGAHKAGCPVGELIKHLAQPQKRSSLRATALSSVALAKGEGSAAIQGTGR